MNEDEKFMGEALKEACKAAERGEVPVGAVIVSGERIMARGHNQPIKKNDPTAHAEIVALRKACAQQKNYRLAEGVMYVTVEPCAMCLGAIVQARIKRLVFGALDPKAGAVLSIMTFPMERTNHRMEILGGIRAEECGRVLKNFFKAKRAGLKPTR
ncbi:MAG: tRNA adenosine(34) deaminase TadA [Candidatus Aminicenantes bacterium]|nr:tRNA adenosine(34) deaminase TadA [Candidatus Aminicenantes bacterium]